jgi:ABC-type uncharacterized transport system substrate-binding protein
MARKWLQFLTEIAPNVNRVAALFNPDTAPYVISNYLPSFQNAARSRRSADYVNLILKGDKPSDMPVHYPNKYELAINMKTAKALGLTIPETLLATADEVIQ